MQPRIVKYEAFCGHIARNLAETYSELYQDSPLAKVVMSFNKVKEFDLDDVTLHFMPPRRPISPKGELSSGEHAMAAISLLCTHLSYSKAPFIILTNVDNILNNESTRMLMNFLNVKSFDMQIIMFSSKPMNECPASKVFGIVENTHDGSSEACLVSPDNYLPNP